ncbi:hypothetical protein GQ55_5G458400 [Panicum hallii var. hallii]|jgi:hypothetical protein|uniref:Uncharacterized protein n=2 Tax=Panicum hallii TaxID=206008 RepID=A0A2T7DQG9_9POAL|nr:uncharacterized protein LOC112895234 [Panicum hallii]PAN31988.1 hypothetical protein PAHAL_5G455000 [Panicum hallii]PUZ57806.1 hypothetical protein GQ55_5G458400 [Panicum hallii var. hallii]
MQLASCELPAAARCAGAAAGRSGRRPSLTTAAPALTAIKKPAAASPPPRAVRCRCSSSRRDDDAEFGCSGGGGLVDEGMVVLRRRIHEMRAAESNWEPPEEWAAWEKEWYGTYDADVCELVGALQAFLVSSRPGVGVGLLAVLVLAVPASAFALVSHLLDASRAIITSLHH